MLVSSSRALLQPCLLCQTVVKRQFSASISRRQAAALPIEEFGRRPIGALRGGALGFLLGVAAVGAAGVAGILAEYRHASQKLLAAVEDLSSTSERLKGHVERTERLEEGFRLLQEKTVSREELDGLQESTRRLTSNLRTELLELKTDVLDVEQDVSELYKHLGTRIRI